MQTKYTTDQTPVNVEYMTTVDLSYRLAGLAEATRMIRADYEISGLQPRVLGRLDIVVRFFDDMAKAEHELASWRDKMAIAQMMADGMVPRAAGGTA
jgi:hypothetical protein